MNILIGIVIASLLFKGLGVNMLGSILIFLFVNTWLALGLLFYVEIKGYRPRMTGACWLEWLHAMALAPLFSFIGVPLIVYFSRLPHDR